MRMISRIALALGLSACSPAAAKWEPAQLKQAPADGGRFYSFTVKDIDGKDVPLSRYRGKVLLLVNVASKCGNTPQYKGLEALHQRLQGKGFEILGFPANNFFGQEPGSDKEIKEFCTLTYGVKFPMFSKIEVKGKGIAPLYHYLTTETDFKGDVEWNFAKFLVNREGRVVARFKPRSTVDEPEVLKVIEAAL